MAFGRIIRIVFFSFVLSLFQSASSVCLASSFETAEQLSALVALPAIWVERSYENPQGAGAKKMAKISKVFAHIVRLASGALTLKNQYDYDNENMCLQKYKYTALWLLIDAVKLGIDILPESFLEQLIAIFPDDALKNIDEVCLTDFEKSIHQFFSTDRFAKRLRTTFLPGVEMTTLLVLAFTKNKNQNIKFYASGIKGLCRSFDEYLGATNTTVKRLFLILFVAHITSLIYDGFEPPVFEEKKKIVVSTVRTSTNTKISTSTNQKLEKKEEKLQEQKKKTKSKQQKKLF